MVSELENLLGITATQGHNSWELQGYKPVETGTQSGKKGVRFILKGGKETVLITARSLLRVVVEAEKKYGSINGCVLEFDCYGDGLGRTYSHVKCDKPSDVAAFL